jgi:hypothetical protein
VGGTLVVEVLFFAGCPNQAGAQALVEWVTAEAGVDPDVRLVRVEGAEDARRLRFLGSPTVRVNGHDVEPGADQRQDFAYACRIYRTPLGVKGQPEASWLRAALHAARLEEAHVGRGDPAPAGEEQL